MIPFLMIRTMTNGVIELKLAEYIALFKTLSFPVELDHMKDGVKTPFGTYTFRQPNFSADDRVFVKTVQFELRVFVSKLDPAIDAEIEKLFFDNEIAWSKDEPVYIEDSNAYEIDYSFGVIVGG